MSSMLKSSKNQLGLLQYQISYMDCRRLNYVAHCLNICKARGPPFHMLSPLLAGTSRKTHSGVCPYYCEESAWGNLVHAEGTCPRTLLFPGSHYEEAFPSPYVSFLPTSHFSLWLVGWLWVIFEFGGFIPLR